MDENKNELAVGEKLVNQNITLIELFRENKVALDFHKDQVKRLEVQLKQQEALIIEKMKENKIDNFHYSERKITLKVSSTFNQKKALANSDLIHFVKTELKEVKKIDVALMKKLDRESYDDNCDLKEYLDLTVELDV